jgi:hypothetical protein
VGFFRYPSIPHLPGSLYVEGDRLYGRRAAGWFFGQPWTITVTEKLDGYNVAVGFDRPYGLRVVHRRVDLYEAFLPWAPPALVWIESELGRLHRMLGQEWILCGEWVDAGSSLRYEAVRRFYAFDLLHRPTGRFRDREELERRCAAAGIEASPRLYRGRVPSFDAALGLLERSRLGPERAEGLVLAAEEGGLVRRRAKFVRPDFRRRPDVEPRPWAAPRERGKRRVREGRGLELGRVAGAGSCVRFLERGMSA